MNASTFLINPSERATLFPVTRRWNYLNHAAIGPLPAYVRQASLEYLEEISNSGARHWLRTAELIEELRGQVARFVRMRPEEVAFTRNVSEGIGILANGLDWEVGDNVVLPAIEVPANVYPWLNLDRLGVQVRFVPLREGGFTVEDVARFVDARTRVVSVSSVQFLNGFRSDLQALGAYCRDKGVLFCVDAIQQLGVAPLDAGRAGIDFLACGSHKWLMAGEGSGFICCRQDLLERLRPAATGWMGVRQWEDFLDYRLEFPETARRFETGNPSVFGLRNLSASLDFIGRTGGEAIEAAVTGLARRVAEHASKRSWPLLRPGEAPRSGIVSFKVPGREAQALVDALEREGAQVSCRNGAIRVSPHFYNTAGEIESFFDCLDAIISNA